MITAEQVADIRRRDAAIREWLGKRNSYHPDELPTYLRPSPTNSERSAAEIFEFCNNPPDRYFLYVKPFKQDGTRRNDTQLRGMVTTWMGDKLGDCILGNVYHDNFGGKRQSITVWAINGHTYHGTYFTSTGDYARIKRSKGK